MRWSDAERVAVQKVRTMDAQFEQTFPESKNQDAIRELQRTNPARYGQMMAAAQRVAQARNQWINYGEQAMQQRQMREAAIASHQHAQVRANWHQLKDGWDKEFGEYAKAEFADPVKHTAMKEGVRKMLTVDEKIPDDQLGRLWNGEEGISLRSTAAQKIMLDAWRWRSAMANAHTIANKRAPVPPVVRPGTRNPGAGIERGDDDMATIRSIERQMETATGKKAMDLSVKLAQAKRRAGQL
jgi:hypothetical protein